MPGGRSFRTGAPEKLLHSWFCLLRYLSRALHIRLFSLMLPVEEFFLGHDQQRLPALTALRYQRMQADAFAFFRGSAPLYYARLTDAPPLPASPLA